MISTLVRTSVLYFFVTFAIRIMGKRQIGDMQPNELVVTLLISEIAAIPLQDTNQPIMNGIIAVTILVILEIIISVLAMKFFRVRKIFSGSSVILIKDGVIDQKALKQVRLTVIDLIELLRGQGIFNIYEVAFAVLEVNGSLSIVPKSCFRPVQLGDISEAKKLEKAELPLPVIIDGKIIDDSVKALGIKETQLVKKAGINIKSIFLMTLDKHGNKTVIKKEE